MATLKQKTAIKKTCENLRNKTIQPMGEVMVESGYKPSVAKHPKILTESNAWREAMESVNFSGILKEIEDQAFLKNNTDKDNCLRNKELIMKIGGKIQKEDNKFTSLFTSIKNITKDGQE